MAQVVQAGVLQPEPAGFAADGKVAQRLQGLGHAGGGRRLAFASAAADGLAGFLNAGGPVHFAARVQGVAHGLAQVAARGGFGRGGQVGHAALGDEAAAAHARAGADVDQVLGAADGVFVVLHHDQRVAFGRELVQRVQQDVVVARMQADGGFVEHVAHALQVAAQLGGQADALGFAAAERGRAPVQREVAQADLLQKFKAAADFGQQIARNFRFAPLQAQRGKPLAQLADAHAGQFGDGDAVVASGAFKALFRSFFGSCPR